MLTKIKDFVFKYRIVFILIIGLVLRLVFIGRMPGNNNIFQDEAFSAYEAYSLSNYGIDSHGYHNPVYLEVWGSGMSAMQCYMQIIFMKIFGATNVAIRLPQAILGCITLWFFYLLVKEIADENTGLWAAFILTICPWHVCLSRWGFDCNYFVGLVTIAMYLLVSSNNKLWKTILAGVFGGLALYGYASPWIVMPVLLYGTIIFLFVKKEINIKSIAVYTISLAIVALPLLLFVAVNMGLMPEIKTGIISIPKLGFFRSGDVAPSLEKLKLSITYFWTQYDFCSWNSTPKYGVYFLFSNIFLIIGIIKDIIKPSKRSVVIWIWFACGIVLASMVEANFNRLNILFMPLLYFIATGVVFVISIFKKFSIVATIAMLLLYGVNGAIFGYYYFTDYNQMMERVWPEGAEEAIAYAQNFNGTIHVCDLRYPEVLWFSKYPVEKFVDTVEYADPNAEFLAPLSFEGYDMTEFWNEEPVTGDVYICSVENQPGVDYLAVNPMDMAQFGNYYVGVAR